MPTITHTNKFSIKGMTCQSCVKNVTEALKKISHVNAASVDLTEGSATLKSDEDIQLDTIKDSLANMPKYAVDHFTPSVQNLESEKSQVTPVSKFTTYKPLITVFSFVLLVSLAFQIFNENFNPHLFMNHIMAGFFIGLSFFKFLNIKAFADSFSGYDPIAQIFPSYGLGYPFIELALGLLFVSGRFLLAANIVTILILAVTTVGVIKRLKSNSQFQCACLGTAFSLPLSGVTVFENVSMILMAAFGIVSRF